MARAHAAVVVALAVLASACGSNPAPPPPASGSTPQLPLPTLSPVPGSLGRDNSNAQLTVDAALQDAATHLGTAPDQLHVEQVQERQWPDSSLGCPKPGLMYSQIVTPGFLIVISSSTGRRLEYHTDTRAHVVLCQES
jgi:hypothetical protein